MTTTEKALTVYLNDHLAGAMLGTDLADQIKQRNEGTPLGDLMAKLSAEIEEDRQTLIDLANRMDASQNAIKQATSWMAEKASRVKFSGLGSGDRELGNFMSLEALMLGVRGKAALWTALKSVAGEYEALATTDLDNLIARAESQYELLERERLAAGRVALSQTGAVANVSASA